jgi:hypothetical protein
MCGEVVTGDHDCGVSPRKDRNLMGERGDPGGGPSLHPDRIGRLRDLRARARARHQLGGLDALVDQFFQHLHALVEAE